MTDPVAFVAELPWATSTEIGAHFLPRPQLLKKKKKKCVLGQKRLCFTTIKTNPLDKKKTIFPDLKKHQKLWGGGDVDNPAAFL